MLPAVFPLPMPALVGAPTRFAGWLYPDEGRRRHILGQWLRKEPSAVLLLNAEQRPLGVVLWQGGDRVSTRMLYPQETRRGITGSAQLSPSEIAQVKARYLSQNPQLRPEVRHVLQLFRRRPPRLNRTPIQVSPDRWVPLSSDSTRSQRRPSHG